jgi:enoyl-[acyl-carrier-protein] reductase (NADH)
MLTPPVTDISSLSVRLDGSVAVVTGAALGISAWDNPKGMAHMAEIPVGRFAMPEEIAATAAFLASGAAGMMNGADLVVDGGYTIR